MADDHFNFTIFKFVFTVVGLVFFLLDIVLDMWAVVSFYQEEAYVYMGLLVFLLVGSSLLVHAFSLLWFLDDKNGNETKTESLVKNISSLKVLHVFQMGVFLRYACCIRISICGFCCGKTYMERDVVSQNLDLTILRLFEAFSESIPQLVLMLTFILQRGEPELFTMLKALVSAGAISLSVTTYHSSLRSSLEDKAKQGWGSSVVYFLWNLLLIGPRVAAVVLFTSVFPCYIAAHFLSYWMVLFFFAFRCETKFMDSAGGEWLYQATIGLIWYFSWFSVVEHTRMWRTFYHFWIAVDILMLCGLWVWQMKINPPYFDLPLDPYVIFGVMMSLYFAGLCLMGVYYKYCHPNITQQKIPVEAPLAMRNENDEEMRYKSLSSLDEQPYKRMKNLADNFYS